MNYNEFRKTYAWTLKNYSGTYNLFFNDFDGYMIGEVVIEKYVKHGNKWELVNETKEDVTPAYYFNTLDAVPFFRNAGGYERVTCGYCVLGYVPLEIVSISPWKDSKTVRKFKLF